MVTLEIIATAGSVAGVATLGVAALHDVMSRTVPNRMSLAVVAGGLVSQGARACSGQGSPLLALGAAVAVFVLCAMLWRRGLMGGADVKLLAASALLFPPDLVPVLLASVSIAGAVLAMPYLFARRRLARPAPGRPVGFAARVLRAERWRLRRGGPLPYAVAIACGAGFVLARSMLAIPLLAPGALS